jgi:hypothetical protein
VFLNKRIGENVEHVSSGKREKSEGLKLGTQGTWGIVRDTIIGEKYGEEDNQANSGIVGGKVDEELTKDLNGIDGGDGTSLDEELEVIGELQDSLKVLPKTDLYQILNKRTDTAVSGEDPML